MKVTRRRRRVPESAPAAGTDLDLGPIGKTVGLALCNGYEVMVTVDPGVASAQARRRPPRPRRPTLNKSLTGERP